MKKILLILMLILVSGGVFASEFASEMGQASYTSKESVWARLHFEVELVNDLDATDLSVSDLDGSKLSVTKKLDKVSDHDYYFSFILPTIPDGKYKIFLEDVRYLDNSQLKVSDFEVVFDIVNRAEGLQIWPPVWIDQFDNAFDPQTNLIIKNIGNNVTYVDIADEGTLISMISPAGVQMMPNVLHWINIRSGISDYTSGFQSTSVVLDYGNGVSTVPVVLRKKFYTGDYDVPLYSEVEVNITDTVEIVNITNEVNLTNETVINVSSLSNVTGKLEFIYPFEGEIVSIVEDITEIIEIVPLIKNTGEVVVTELDVMLTQGLNEIISYDLKSSALKGGESASIALFFDLTNTTVTRYVGELIVKSSEGVSASLPIDISLPGSEEDYFEENASQEFIGEAGLDYDALEDLEEKPSYVGWIVVVCIVVIFMGLGYFFYRKGRKKDKAFGDFIDSVKRR